MNIGFLRIVPVVMVNGTVLRQHVLSVDVRRQWRRVNDFGSKLRFQRYEITLRWPLIVSVQLYVSKYGVGDYLAEHVDQLIFGRLFRILVIAKKPARGGELLCERFIVNLPRLKIFEPSRWKHEVTIVEEGERLVLNFGIWVARLPKPASWNDS